MFKTIAVSVLLFTFTHLDFVHCQITGTGPTAGNPQTAAPSQSAPATTPTVTNACLHCICDASSRCRTSACHLIQPGQYFCGPYLISWAYWADAGKPQDDESDPYAFEKCLKDKTCSELTIRNYMARYAQDCNADGVIDCVDFARIHKSGPTACNATWIDNSNYFKVFKSCMSQISS